MHSLLQWFRKQLISFVQLAYGGTINKSVHLSDVHPDFLMHAWASLTFRSLHETIDWLMDDAHLLMYIQTFHATMSMPYPEPRVRTPEDLLATRNEVSDIPYIFVSEAFFLAPVLLYRLHAGHLNLQARKKLLASLPRVLSSLLGTNTLHRGVTKVSLVFRD